MKLPFGYEVRLTKRNFAVIKDGKMNSFVDWMNGGITNYNTPIMEEIYTTIANEFAKIDFSHIIDRKDVYKVMDDQLNYVVSERPNELQSKYEFLFTMMYQLWKYGNAIAVLYRDKKGNVVKIEPLNAEDYMFGSGYQVDSNTVFFKFKNKRTNQIELIDYQNLVHLRLNPNNIFKGDLISIDLNKNIINLIDSSLSSLINELKDSGTVKGIIQIGESGIGYSNGFANRAMANQEEKISKQQEILNRIKATKGGILVLDAGETWKDLASPFKTVTSKDIDTYIDLLLQFNGINKKVVDGTATEEEMEVFFNKTIAPRIEQFLAEMNYKCFSKTARSQGHRIEFYRNPFEYVSVIKAIDIAYKGMQDTTTNERRRMIYHLPPIENGDLLLTNKNFERIGEGNEKGENDGE